MEFGMHNTWFIFVFLKLQGMRKHILLVFIILQSIFVFGQKEKFKFGAPSVSDLEMTVYPNDSSAAAVILFDKGVFNPEAYEFTRTVRIKILKKEGLGWGDHFFPVAEKSMVKGYTINYENGVIEKTKLEKESIFKEKVTNGYYRVRTSMPNVKVGSIIDLEFTYEGLPSEWRFQELIPVRYSELNIERVNYLDFRLKYVGYIPLTVVSEDLRVAENVPAFKPEPYINSIENYISKIKIEILSINFAKYGYYESFSTSWKTVRDNITKSQQFGDMTFTSFLNKYADAIEGSYSKNSEKLNAAMEVIKNVSWNESNSILVTNNAMQSVFDKKTGNSAEINFMLMALVKKLGFEVTPVVLSTRDNGIINPVDPTLIGFNYVIIKAVKDNEEYYLDATQKYLPYNLLPLHCLNGYGLLMSEYPQMISLNTKSKYKIFKTYNLTLNPDMSLTGKLEVIRYEYAAYDFRTNYASFNSKEAYLNDFTSNQIGLQVTDFKLNNKDSLTKPIQEIYEIRIENAMNEIDGEYYLSPLLYDKQGENPFNNEKREYPIDFGYPIEKNTIVNIQLPENLTVSQLPKSILFKISDNTAKYQYMVKQENNTIQVFSKLNLDNVIYLQAMYPELRELYSQMVNRQSEMIGIKIMQ